MQSLRRQAVKLWKRPRVRLGIIIGGVIVAMIIVVLSYVSLFNNKKPVSSKHGDTSSSSSKKSSKSKSKPTETPKPSPTATSSSAGVATQYPSSILNLTNWKLTLPIARPGSSSNPQEIVQPQLANFMQAPYFQLTGDKSGVQFQAPVGGVTTSGSSYPRSELREMANNGSTEASWSDTNDTRTMTVREAITHIPVVKPEIVAAQIHGPKEYVILIRLESSNLFVEADGKNVGTLDSNYSLGTAYTLKIVAGNGHIVVYYNGAQKADYQNSGSGYYFKAGAYVQSNPSKGDAPTEYGEVVIYDLQLT